MRERRYRRDSAVIRAGPSTSRSSRPNIPPWRRDYAARHGRGRETYSPEAEGSRRVSKDDRFGRGFDSRSDKVSDYNDRRDRDRFAVDVGSPRRSDRRDRFDRDRDEPLVRQSGRLNDRHRMAALSPDFNGDFYANGSRRSNHDHVEDYGHTRFDRARDTDSSRDGGGRGYNPESRYSDGGGAGRLLLPQYLDEARSASVEYDREGRMLSGSYTLNNGSRGAVTRSNVEKGEFGRNVSSVEVGYFHLQNELLKKRDDALLDKEKNHLEVNEFDHFGNPYQDKVVREPSRDMKEANLLSSRDYVKSGSDFFHSLSRSEEYVSSSLGILRENFPGRSASSDIHMPSDVVQHGVELASEPTTSNGYSEKQLYRSPRSPGDRRKNTSCSRPYLLPEGKHEDHFYASYGRIENASISTRTREENRHYHISSMGDDGPWDPLSAPHKFNERRSLHGRKRDHNIFGSGSSHLEYGIEVARGYGRMENMEYPAEVVGAPISPRFRGNECSLGRPYDSPRKRLAACDMSLAEPSERRLEYERLGDDVLIHRAGITMGNADYSRDIYSQVNGRDEIDCVSLRKCEPSNLDNEKRRRAPSQRSNHQSSPAKPIKSRRLNLSQRLGPVPRWLNLSQRQVSAKKRLGPAVPT